MHTLYAVIDELYSFVMTVTFTVLGQRKLLIDEQKPTQSMEPMDVSLATQPHTMIELPVVEEEPDEEPQSFKSIDEILNLEHTAPSAAVDAVEKNTIMYVGSTEAPVYQNPTREFDSRIGTLTFSEMVMVLGEQGRYASIAYGEDRGWVLREDLADRAAYVYPNFVIGEENNPEDPNTVRVRGILGDIFGGGVLEVSLQAPEYVEYRLRRKGHHIAWPSERPRIAGTWHKILKGQQGVKMGIVPKTGSVMEYMQNEETGQLAYVESVFPDETIKISEIGFPDSGIYNERVLTREEWRELKPIFIQVM